MRKFARRTSRILAAGLIVLQLCGGFTLGIQQVIREHAAAQAPCPNYTLGRCEREGYFTGLHLEYNSPGDPTPPPECVNPPYGFTCGIWQNTDYLGVTNAAQFISVVSNNLNLNFDACRGTSPMPNFFGVGWSLIDTDWDQPDPIHTCYKNKARATHAAFLIWSMLGRNGTDFGNTPDSNYTGVQFGKLAFAQWSAMVNWYAANGLANFNAFVAPPCIGGFATQTFNVIRYGQDVGFITSFGCAPPADTILFSIPGGGTFEINKSCANVKGPLTPLASTFNITPFTQVPTLSPSDSPTTANFQSSISVDRRAGPINVARSYFIRRGALDLAPFASFSTNNTYDPGTYPFTHVQTPIPGVQLGDQICQRMTVSPAAGTADPSGAIGSLIVPSQSSEACARFLTKPYSKAYGGDVAIGAGFGTGCAVDGDASLIGFNRGAAPFTGAGTQLAAMALGQILDYSSAQIISPNAPKSLSFANTGGGFAASVYGGDLGNSYAVCAPDYYAQATAPLTGNVVIPSHTLALGTKETVYVDGNAFISAPGIMYAGGAYANIGQIPSYRLIVRGNIYVEPGVTQLSGLYIAQPNPATPNTTGRFYSCASLAWAVGHTPPYAPNAADLATSCTTPLTVYGAVAANLVKLTRTRGTVSQSSVGERYNTVYPATQGPAEIFVFSPEVWLNGNLSSTGGGYDSINVLPPLL